MRRALIAVVVLGMIVALAVGTATANAYPGQAAGQDNSSGQAAGALAGSGQAEPSNTAVGIRVLSPGDDGNVGQSNSADANALAGNGNLTGQRSTSRRRLWHASRGPGQLERPVGRRRRGRPAGQAEQHRRRDPSPQPRRRRQRPPVQQRRRKRAGRQHQPHRPDDRPVPRRDRCAVDRALWLPVRHPGRGPVERELARRRRPRRRRAGQAEQHGCRDPGAEPW